MPRSKNPENYPREYWRLLDAVASGRLDNLEIPMPDIKAVRNVKNSLYAYINAVDHDERKVGKEYNLCDAPRFRRVSLQEAVQDGVAMLVLRNKDATPEITAISNALATALPDDEPPPPVDSSTAEDSDDQMASAISSLFNEREY